MHRLPLLFAIALSLTNPAIAQTPALPVLKSHMPIRLENEGLSLLTLKIVGPTLKTLRLGPSENQYVMLLPGEYFCVYRFKGEPGDPPVFKRGGRFQVPVPDPAQPAAHFSVVAAEEDRARVESKWETREVQPSSLKEFTEAGAANPASANNQTPAEPDATDSLRLTSLNLMIIVGEPYYGETPAQKRQQKNLIVGQLTQYVRTVLTPRLTRQGFKVNYLGLRDQAYGDTFPTEPILAIDYSETEGQAYTIYSGYGEPAAYGVEISCSLSLYHPSIIPGASIWDAALTATNDESIKMSFFADKEAVLHNQALKYLREQLNDLALDLSDWAPRGGATIRAAGRTPSHPVKTPTRSRTRQ